MEGLNVRIHLSKEQFVIEDNCGGIPLKTAREYAFRFGRPVDAPPIESSVGLFGVGMKRAIFKLGRRFEVQSSFGGNSFSVKVDVDTWLTDEDWEFPLEVESEPVSTSGDSEGTTIRVVDLLPGVADQFSTNAFLAKLQNEVRTRHHMYLDRGLNIQINGAFLVASFVEFACLPSKLKPAREVINQNGVTVSLYSGVGRGGPEARANAGWYVYCNGRMVVRADQTELTGWGSLGNSRVPRYHHQFARFRAAAFFNSANPKSYHGTQQRTG